MFGIFTCFPPLVFFYQPPEGYLSSGRHLFFEIEYYPRTGIYHQQEQTGQ